MMNRINTGWEQAIDFFVGTFAELAILFVLVSFLVSVINYKLPTDKVKRLLSGNKGYGIAISLGAVTPFCSCSTLPMMVGLLKARAAFGPVMAFLFTSPLLNPFVVALFWITFGAKITLVYAIFVVTLAVACGAVLEQLNFQRFIRPELLGLDSGQTRQRSCGESPSSHGESNNSTCGGDGTPGFGQAEDEHDIKPSVTWLLVKETVNQFTGMIPYMVIGVAIGAVLHGFVPQQFFASIAQVNLWLLIPLTAIVGVFLYVRASTMVPIAASLTAKGVSMGAIMSLTIAGAGASLPEMVMLKKLFHWPLLSAFVLLVFTTACLTGFVIELLVIV